MKRKPAPKPEVWQEKECEHCGRMFRFFDTLGKAKMHHYCSDSCRWKGQRRRKAMREKGELESAVVAMYAFLEDPWKTGQLPKSVTENQLYV